MPFSHSSLWTWKDVAYRFDVYESDDFTALSHVVQVYAIALYMPDQTIALTHNRAGDIWTLPGGSVEEGETWHQTLIREMKEETNCDVLEKTIIPAFYQTKYMKGPDGEWIDKGTQLRYLVQVDQITPFVADPDDDIIEVKWVPLSNIESYLQWGKASELIVTLTNKYIAEHKQPCIGTKTE